MSISFRCGDFVVVGRYSGTAISYLRSSVCNIFYNWVGRKKSFSGPQEKLSLAICCAGLL